MKLEYQSIFSFFLSFFVRYLPSPNIELTTQMSLGQMPVELPEH